MEEEVNEGIILNEPLDLLWLCWLKYFCWCVVLADIISTVEFNENGELLATGDKGGRIVIFQRDQPSKSQLQQQIHNLNSSTNMSSTNINNNFLRNEYSVYSTFQSHEAEFDYLKSLEIEEKINKIKWLRRKNVSHFLLSTNDKTVKLWKIR